MALTVDSDTRAFAQAFATAIRQATLTGVDGADSIDGVVVPPSSYTTDDGNTINESMRRLAEAIYYTAYSYPLPGTAGGGGVPSSRLIIAGDGLKGGGSLASDVSLLVGEGDGIQVDADSVSVRLAGSTLSKGPSGLYVTNGAINDLSGTNTGDMTMGVVGSTPNAYGGTIASQILTLQPANENFGGIVSTTAQTFSAGLLSKKFVNTSTSTRPVQVQNLHASGQSYVEFQDNAGNQQGAVGWENSTGILRLTAGSPAYVTILNSNGGLYVDPSGYTVVGNRLGVGGAFTPSYPLHVLGDSYVSGTSRVGTQLYFSDTTVQTTAFTSSYASKLSSLASIYTVTASNGLTFSSNTLGVQLATATLPGTIAAADFVKLSNLSGTNTGDVTLTASGTTPNAFAASLVGQQLQLQTANGTYAGLLAAADYTLLHNQSGTNTGDVTLTASGTTPNANAALLVGQQLQLQTANGTYAGLLSAAGYTKLAALADIYTVTVANGLTFSSNTLGVQLATGSVPGTISAADYTLLHNQSGTNTGDVTLAASGTTPNANAASLVGQQLQLQTANGSFAGLLSAANYTKLTSLQSIYTIGSGLTLTGTTLNNTSMLSSLAIDTFNVAGAQAKALFFDGVNRLSVSAADFTHPGAISLADQIMGAGVKTFQVESANTTLLTPASNEVRIDSFKGASPLVPVLKLYSGSLPKAQFYALNSGVGYLEADTQTILKANANDALSVDGSGNTTILGGTSGVPQVTLGSSGSFWSWDGSGFGQMTISSESFINYVSNSFSTLYGGHRWYFSASLAMTLSENNWLAPGSAAGLNLGTSSLPWGQAWFQVAGTNASVGTASTNQITIRNDSASAQTWLKFNYAGSDKAGIRSDSFGSMVLDGSSDIFFMRSGTTKAQITSTALQPGTTNTLSLGTSSLKWADVQTAAASINGVGVFPMSTGNSARVDTTQTTTSTSYTDLATVGPTVTLTTGTAVLVTVCSFIASSTTSNSGYASFAVSGATTRAAADVDSCFLASGVANIGGTVSRTFVITGLNAGSNTFTMKYRKDGGAGTWSFGFRTITVQRLN